MGKKVLPSIDRLMTEEWAEPLWPHWLLISFYDESTTEGTIDISFMLLILFLHFFLGHSFISRFIRSH